MTKRTCFVISPIGEPGTATRQRADQIYKYVILPVLGEGWLTERADLISEPGIITNKIIDRLVNSDLVIADLSERNPNVFYELAIRHISKKPYVHLIAHDEDIPFDNAPVRAIKIDVTNLDSVHEAKKELAAQIENTLNKDGGVESPISVSLSLSEMRKSGDQEGVLLQSLLSEIGALRRHVSDVASSIERLQSAQANSAAKAAAELMVAYASPSYPSGLLSNSPNFLTNLSASAAAQELLDKTAANLANAPRRGDRPRKAQF